MKTTSDPPSRSKRRFFFGKEQILVLGDSHANVFRNWRFRLHMPRSCFQLSIVGGATVSGLDNPNSKTQARVRFDQALQSSTPTTILTLLGEVDTGFVIWYRAQKHGQSVDDMLELALDNYEQLLLAASSKAHVIAISCPLPTIRDGQSWGEVANLRNDIDATQTMRTDLTLRFNKSLAEIARRLNCSMLSLDDICQGPDGLVAPWLLNRNNLDHHYSIAAYAKLLSSHLASFLNCRRNHLESNKTIEYPESRVMCR